MDGVKEGAEAAEWLTKGSGRTRITYGDVKRAIAELRSPSDASLKRLLTTETKSRGGGYGLAHAAPMQADCKGDAWSAWAALEAAEGDQGCRPTIPGLTLVKENGLWKMSSIWMRLLCGGFF